MVKALMLQRKLFFCALLAGPVAPATATAASPLVVGQCWIDHGALVTPAAFGDIAGDFVLDLSAPVSQLHDTRAGLQGLEGASAAGRLVLAGHRLPAVTLAIVDLDARTRDFDTVINGVLGVDVLSRYVVDIDPSPCRIRLTARAGAPTRGGRTRRGTRVAVDMASGRPLIAAAITDGSSVALGRFALDTADWPITLFGDRLSRGPPTAGAPPPVRLRAMTLGGRLFEQVPAVVAPIPDGGGARGALGLSVLSRWRLRLDMAQGWLELIPAN